jgi:hypothetical protein
MGVFDPPRCPRCGRRKQKVSTPGGERMWTCYNIDCVAYLQGREPSCAQCGTPMEYDNVAHEFVCTNPKCPLYLKSPDP